MEWINRLRKEKGQPPLEDEVEDKGPELYEDLMWIWYGFTSLSHSRSVGMSGPLHITFSEINSYCALYGITSYRKRADFADHVTLLDDIWIEDYYEKDSERRAADESKNKKK